MMMKSVVRVMGSALLSIALIGCAEEKPGNYQEPEGGYKSLDLNQKTPNGGIPKTLTFSSGPTKTSDDTKDRKKTK